MLLTIVVKVEHHGTFMDIELATNKGQSTRLVQATCTSLAQPEPELLKDVSGDLLRPNFSVKSSLAGPNISLSRVDKLRALEDLPESVQDDEDGNADIGSEKRGELVGAPATFGLGEHLEAVEDDD